MPHTFPHWFLLGAGNMGTLAAWYLTRAGHGVTVIRHGSPAPLEKTLRLPDGRQQMLSLPVLDPATLPDHIDHLLVAVKTPYTHQAMAPLTDRLDTDSLVLRFQNGLGALDGLLPAGFSALEAVTTSAVKGQHPDHTVVAENATWLGGSTAPPAWFAALTEHWPDLHWEDDIRPRQWHKLVANALINPLTALYDVPNGRISADPALREQATQLCEEADQVLRQLDPLWPGHSLDNVLTVARATAGNTSSMRADRQRGAQTEIDAINGWLVQQADRLGLAVPANRKVVTAMRRSLTM
ncbi:MAG TPA: 2-dehydropantoate 2-reductase [Alcanivorax sp.]|nr:2-dehydropantoate 2-reductase [Alcanivorax sp.]